MSTRVLGSPVSVSQPTHLKEASGGLLLFAFFLGWATFAFSLIDIGRFSINLLLLASLALALFAIRLSPLILIPAWVLLASSLLAFGVSLLYYPGSSRTYTHLAQSLLAIGVMVGVASMVWERQLPRLRVALSLVTGAVLAFAGYQLVARTLDLPFAFLPITNLQLMSDEGLQRGYGTLYLGAGSFTRVSSFFPEPSDLGRFMLWVFVIGFASRKSGDKLLFMVMGLAGIVLSQSMGAIIGLAVFLPVAMVLKRDLKGGLQALAFVIVATVAFAIVFPANAAQLLERILTILVQRGDYLKETQRFAYLGEGLRIFMERPVFGHGIGSLRSVVSQDAVISNTFLFNLIERGTVGSLLYYAPFFGVFLILCTRQHAPGEVTQTGLFLLVCELYFFSTFAMPYFPPTYFALGFALQRLSPPSLQRTGNSSAAGVKQTETPPPADVRANHHSTTEFSVMQNESPVLILDARANTPAYDAALLRGITRLGQRASLFTADFYPEPYAPANKVPGRFYYFMRLSRQLRRRFKHSPLGTKLAIFLGPVEYVFDLIRLTLYCAVHRPLLHIQWPFVIPCDILFLSFAKVLGLRIVYTVHNPLPHDSTSRLALLLYGMVYHLADRLVFHCDETLREFKSYFTVPVQKCAIIPCGVFFEDREPLDKAVAREQLAWPQDDLIIVFEGHVKPYKGLDVLLRAVADMDPRDHVRLVVSANFRFARMEEYNVLFDAVRRKVALEVVNEIPSDQKFVQIACAADLFVLPYRSGTASMTGMTAVRFGTPLIVTRVGALPEMLGEPWKGFVVEPGNVNALREALECFLALTQQQRDDYGMSLRLRGEQEFGWDNIAQKTVALYKETR